MNWHFPAKTFLVGEYAALSGKGAILLTTRPCFTISLSQISGLHGIHPESPAGRWWLQQPQLPVGLTWNDPYAGSGGLGASTAQFLGVFKTYNSLTGVTFNREEMFKAYLEVAWQGHGTRPSGYDILAQAGSGCVYIQRNQKQIEHFPWAFSDLSFILLRTGKKIATHEHLANYNPASSIGTLDPLVDKAYSAFSHSDCEALIDAVNQYHQALAQFNLVASHSLQQIEILNEYEEVLAAKGCGALGADIILILAARDNQDTLCHKLTLQNWQIIATNDAIF